MESLTAKTAAQFVATFDSEVPADTKITVTKGTSTIDGKVSIDGATVTFDATGKFVAGTYTMTAALGDATTSMDVEVKDEYVAEIKVLGDEALTNATKTRAYIYYDVLNQYGESIRTSTTINWTVSSCKSFSVNKSIGKITAKTFKDDGTDPESTAEPFTYGTKIYVTGVHAKSGASFNNYVTVGMEQAIDSVEFKGFLNKNDKTAEPTDTLPADFAKDTYVLLYQTLDQNGNVYETSGDNIKPISDANGDGRTDSARISVICDNIFLVALDFKDDGIYSVGDQEYASITIQPGLYVDKGGDVNITVISCTTGKASVKNFRVGANGLLKSLTLKEPSKIVADGDTNVKIPYEALDTNGNKVENYETIARSTNALSLNASDGTLVVKEEKDGTAGVYWSDSMLKTAFDDPSASDDIDRPISLTTVVVGGDSQTMMLSVSDMRRPTSIQNVQLNDDANDTIVSGNRAELSSSYNGNNTWSNCDYGWGNFYYLDQYNEPMLDSDWSRTTAETFFDMAADNGFDDYFYGIKVDMNAQAKTLMGVQNTCPDTSNPSTFVYEVGDPKITYNPTSNAVDNAVVKYSIVRIPDNATSVEKAKMDNWDDVSKVKVATYTVVPLNKVKNYAISDMKKLQAVTPYASDPNGLAIAGTVSGSAVNSDVNDKFEENPTSDLTINGVAPYGNGNAPRTNVFKVTGTFDGKTITVPSLYYTVAAGSAFKVTGSTIDSVDKTQIKWSDLYNINDAMKTRKDAVKELKLDIGTVSGGAIVGNAEATIKKAITISDAATAPDKIEFYNPATYDDNLEPKPRFTAFVTPTVRVFDQYTRLMDNSEYSYDVTVSDIKESDSELTRVPKSFVVNRNGSDSTTISGAEIGDTFKYTATVAGTSLSTTKDMTVEADWMACISSTRFDGSNLGLVDSIIDPSGNPGTEQCDCKSADEHLRKEFLGYDR